MWQCKECGKKYDIEPIYCDFCGATENFIEPVDIVETENFYAGVEQNYRKKIENKNFDDYDQMIKDFLNDEYQPVSRKVKEPFEDEMKEKAKEKLRKKRLESLDNEYYESIQTVVGSKSIEKDDYYKDLEDLFKDPIQSGDQTTFNGIFKKDDTMENTFLNPRNRKGRIPASNREGISKQKPKKNIPLPTLNFGKKNIDGVNREVKDEKKLIKIVVGLGSVFILMIVLMALVIGNITKSSDESGKLPSEATMLGFFNSIEQLDETEFMDNPTMISFMAYEGTNEEKQLMLKTIFAMVKSGDMEVLGVDEIEQKGINRVKVTFNISGDPLYKDTFDQLLFRTVDNKTYQLDFTDFVTQYTIANEDNKVESKI
ncbi:MAG: hypothetical protein PHQ32_00850 [Firmicutes bacterium]|nr:hypothetical protein [Bacillota bacterium]